MPYSRLPLSVYLGGPIDYIGLENAHRWRHLPLWSGFKVHCPMCTFQLGEHPEVTIRRNLRDMLEADWAVFRFDQMTRGGVQAFSFGTPVEAWQRGQYQPHTTIIVHPNPLGVYARLLVEKGVTDVVSIQEAVECIARARGLTLGVRSPAGSPQGAAG